ncbi:MAG TPA: glutaminyl-peptide cyclotransferase [Longimicrobium sp.]|nr:glutaminyl-peptide cyclotransferase [Longimicrobium sp.]
MPRSLVPRRGTRLLAAGGFMALAAALGACPGTGDANDAEIVAGAPTQAARAVRSYPHDPTAFTQGLVFRNGELLESTGRFGESSLRRVKLETGEVLQRVAVPKEYFAEGLAVIGDRAFQLTWQNGVGFIYDLTTFRQTGTFPYQGEGWGLTTDSTSLILSDGSSMLRFLDPTTFAVTRTVEVKDGSNFVDQLNELEWVRGEIWANVWHKDVIARIDPRDGRVLGWLDVGQLLPEATARSRSARPPGPAPSPRGGAAPRRATRAPARRADRCGRSRPCATRSPRSRRAPTPAR